MKRPDGVTAIAVWYFVDAFFVFVFACAILAIPFTGVIYLLREPIAERVLYIMTTCLVVLGLFFGLALVFAGWGLLRMKQWARWLAFMLAIITLFFFPIGTVIGALIIWYLLKGDVNEAFEKAAEEVYPELEAISEQAEETESS